MHTTEIGDTRFFHNGDFSGDIEIVNRTGLDNLKIPFDDIKGLVADYVRGEKISRIENADDDKILGL